MRLAWEAAIGTAQRLGHGFLFTSMQCEGRGTFNLCILDLEISKGKSNSETTAKTCHHVENSEPKPSIAEWLNNVQTV